MDSFESGIIDCDVASDSLLARLLQEEYDQRDINEIKSTGDGDFELVDPCPDIRALFLQYNQRFFEGKLDCVTVSWSKQMTLCAGLCKYDGRGGLCEIHLSEPLLKFRPTSDLQSTLLHEMIHAYLFITFSNRDHSDHGPEFRKNMRRVNAAVGQDSDIRVTVYHSFNDEVEHYRIHRWQCQGPCQSRPPFFGIVKRAKNRAPGPCDYWWTRHQKECGGSFVKISPAKNDSDGHRPTKSASGKRNANASTPSGERKKKSPKLKHSAEGADRTGQLSILEYIQGAQQARK